MKTIIFIALQLSQPRCIKRIETVVKAGIPIKVYGFDSGLYNERLKNLSFPVERIIRRDKTKNKFQKVWSFLHDIKSILKENQGNNCVFYLFGYEIASIAWFLGCKSYIYEEADVTASRYKKCVVRETLLLIDRKIIKKSHLTIFTSQGFSEYLFGDRKPDHVIFLPNKLTTYFDAEKKASVVPEKINRNHIKFGFIGLIRYPDTIIRFAKIIGRGYPQHEFHFYGEFEKMSMYDEELKSFSNVYIHGGFVNPYDLPSIYSQVDINIVCYDTNSGNVRIAEPNKLYESIFFETPLIVSTNTFLAKRVQELGVGFDIDCSNDILIKEFIDNIDESTMNGIQSKMHSLPLELVIDDTSEFIDKCKIVVCS